MNDVPVCVLDISVLLYTPEALYDFPDKEVVIPVSYTHLTLPTIYSV